ncbi:hypothetical protein GTW71_15485, partial [Streptomyces sp. SID6041]|nr:hypothetical protein [Streptomyces sp. SID6041]
PVHRLRQARLGDSPGSAALPRRRLHGALLLVDDAPWTGTVQYLVHGDTPAAAARTEERLRSLAENL